MLVDGGSALNLLFAGALKELGLGITDLTPSDSFWGVVSGRASKPLGEITLLVQFGTASNYHVEHINVSYSKALSYQVTHATDILSIAATRPVLVGLIGRYIYAYSFQYNS